LPEKYWKEKMDKGNEKTTDGQTAPYTCNDYRQEMILLAMRRKLHNGGLSEEESRRLQEEITRLEAVMDMD
jgi:hypothetical protein